MLAICWLITDYVLLSECLLAYDFGRVGAQGGRTGMAVLPTKTPDP